MIQVDTRHAGPVGAAIIVKELRFGFHGESLLSHHHALWALVVSS